LFIPAKSWDVELPTAKYYYRGPEFIHISQAAELDSTQGPDERPDDFLIFQPLLSFKNSRSCWSFIASYEGIYPSNPTTLPGQEEDRGPFQPGFWTGIDAGGNQPDKPNTDDLGSLVNTVFQFGLSFAVIIWIWWLYNNLITEQDRVRNGMVQLNILLLFLAVIEPFLLSVSQPYSSGKIAHSFDRA
jgi:hypothetical protein